MATKKKPTKIEVILPLNKVTKNALQYQAADRNDGGHIPTLYIKQAAFDEPWPEQITVTVTI